MRDRRIVRVRRREEWTVQSLRLANCAKCSLCPPDRRWPERPVFGWGPTDARLVVVGEAPGVVEKEVGRPFAGPSGALLWKTLEQCGVDAETVYASNALLCTPPEDESPKAKDLVACSGRLRAELAGLPEKRVIMTVGKSAAMALRDAGAANVRMGDLSGRAEWSESLGCWLVFAYHPAAVLRDADLYLEFLWGLRRAVGMLSAPKGPRPVREIAYQTAVTAHECLELIREAAKHDTIVCDIETTGLDCVGDRILEVGFCWDRLRAFIVPGELLSDSFVLAALVRLFSEPTILWVYHNGKFDTQFLREAGIPARVGADTMLMHHCLDERGGESKGFHGLKPLAAKFCQAPAYADRIDAAKMAEVPTDERQRYQANDLVYTYRLYEVLSGLLEREPKSPSGYPTPREVHDHLLIPAANALARIERRGVRINLARLRALRAEYDGLIEAARQACIDASGTSDAAFNPNSWIQVHRLLYGAKEAGGLGYPELGTTDEASLHELARHDRRMGREPHQFLDAVLEYRSLRHTKSTYLDGIAARLGRGTAPDRLSSNFLLHGTTTGRLSSRNPNLQNIPKASVIKELFIPSEGRLLGNADYKQLEVRVLYRYSRDPALRDALTATDFHWANAVRVFPAIADGMEKGRADLDALERLCRETPLFADLTARQSKPTQRTDEPETLYAWMKEHLRRQAKYITFGIMYGEGARALSGEEKGLGVDVEEAERYRQGWLDAYPVAARSLAATARRAQNTRWVESESGRRRRFPYPPELDIRVVTEAMNHPIQAFASDICLKAMIALEDRLPADGLGDVLFSVHDSILFEFDPERRAEALEVVRYEMTHACLDDDLVFDVDIGTGESWAACH